MHVSRIFSAPSFCMTAAVCALVISGICAAPMAVLGAPPASGRGKTAPATKPKPASTNRKPQPGVNEMFAAALKLYQAQRYENAILAFDAILRRYPGHEPTIVQYAKSLYRINRIHDSYPLFARLNPQYLDPETSYEFAQAFMSAKQYEGALFAFKRVPNGHPLSDLASYYGAIAAMKLRRYQEAEELMDNAVVLPDKLSKTRTIYMKHLAEMRLLQEKRNLALDRDSEKRRVAGELQQSRRATNATTTPGAVPAPTPTDYQHLGFQEIEKYANLGITYKDQVVDYSGFGDNKSKTQTAFFRFWNGIVLPLDYFQGKRQSAVGVQIKLEAEDIKTEGVEKRLIVEDDTPTIVRIYSEGPQKTNYQNGVFAIAPWLEIPTPNDLWVSVFSELYFNFPEFKRGSRTGSREGGLALGWKQGIHSVLTKAAYLEVLNPDTAVVSTRTRTEAEWIVKLMPALDLILLLKHQQFTYNLDSLDGADSSTLGSATLEQSLPLGILLGLTLGGEYQKNFIANNIPNHGSVAGDGQVLNGKAYLEAQVTPWLFVSVSQLAQKTTWSIQPSEAQEDFERIQPNYLSQLVVEASLNLLF